MWPFVRRSSGRDTSGHDIQVRSRSRYTDKARSACCSSPQQRLNYSPKPSKAGRMPLVSIRSWCVASFCPGGGGHGGFFPRDRAILNRSTKKAEAFSLRQTDLGSDALAVPIRTISESLRAKELPDTNSIRPKRPGACFQLARHHQDGEPPLEPFASRRRFQHVRGFG